VTPSSRRYLTKTRSCLGKVLIKQYPEIKAIQALSPSDKLFSDDALLIPTIPDDPLLRTFHNPTAADART
jgi:hypothetical protein